jgi:hypothetical protein
MVPTFVFDSVSLSTLNATKTYYVQMVSIAPSPSLVTTADLGATLISTPQVLTGTSYAGGIFNFPDQIFNTRTYTNTHVGLIIAERVGASISSTDPLIAFTPHTNSFGQEITKPVGTYAISLDFLASGLFAVVNAWQYAVGAYINNGATLFNNGIIQLIGTKNNTVPYVNPATGANPQIEVLVQSGNAGGANLFQRDFTSAVTSAGNTNQVAFRFRNNGDIKFDSGGLIGWYGINPSNTASIRVWGSNNLSEGWAEAALTNGSNWTELVDLGFAPSYLSRLSTVFSTAGYYKFIKIGWSDTVGISGNLGNIDFYNCTVRTPNENFG